MFNKTAAKINVEAAKLLAASLEKELEKFEALLTAPLLSSPKDIQDRFNEVNQIKDVLKKKIEAIATEGGLN